MTRNGRTRSSQPANVCREWKFLGVESVSFALVTHSNVIAGYCSGLLAETPDRYEGEFYIIDELLLQANWPEGHAEKVPVLLQALASDPSLVIVLPAWASGLVVAVKR